MKEAVDRELEAMLGPKTAEDLAPPPKAAPAPKPAKEGIILYYIILYFTLVIFS